MSRDPPIIFGCWCSSVFPDLGIYNWEALGDLVTGWSGGKPWSNQKERWMKITLPVTASTLDLHWCVTEHFWLLCFDSDI